MTSADDDAPVSTARAADEASARVDVVRVAGAGGVPGRDDVAVEEPLELQVQGVPIAVVMRTPGHDEDLARGFLVTEGVVARAADVASIRHCTTAPTPAAEDNVVQVRLNDGVAFDAERMRRNTYASSSCGVCGKASIDNVVVRCAPNTSPLVVDAAVLTRLPDALRAAQATFATTGGLHAAGLFDAAGAALVVREDVGRHNAVDKVVGWALAHAVDLERAVLLVSGRVSFEVVQKAAVARVPIVAGISAPTSLAVETAHATGTTLVGFLRGETMNLYAHPARVRSLRRA